MCLSKLSPGALVAPFLCTFAHLFLSLCFSQFLLALVTWTDDPHRLKRAIKTHVRSHVISLSIHAVASLNTLLTSQCFRILEHILFGCHRTQIAQQYCCSRLARREEQARGLRWHSLTRMCQMLKALEKVGAPMIWQAQVTNHQG